MKNLSSKEEQEMLETLKLLLNRDMPFRAKLLFIQRMTESILIEIKIRENGNTEPIHSHQSEKTK